MIIGGEKWLTVDEAAIMTGYHPETIRKLLREGRIAGRKVSIVWLIDRQSLIAYLEGVQAIGKKRGPKSEI